MMMEFFRKLFGNKNRRALRTSLLDLELKSSVEAILIDGSELALVGEEAAINSYLDRLPQSDRGAEFQIEKVFNNIAIYNAASAANAIIDGSQQYGHWIKLTEESFKQVQASGLLQTKVAGVNYLATGDFGSSGPWLKSESGSLFSNPAFLASTATLVAQMAMSSELAAMKEMLKQIDYKLDSLASHNRALQLAKLDRVTFAIQDASIRAESQGGVVNAITWSQIQGESAVLDESQGVAIRSMESILESSRGASVKELGKLAKTIGQESSVWISVLGRTLELREELAILEISRTAALKEDEALNHRASVRKALDERRRIIISTVETFSQQLHELTPLAYESVVLHAAASRKLVNGLNAALNVASEFGKALGKDFSESNLEPMPWVRAAFDKDQRDAALKQVVVPIVETAKDAAKATKNKIEEIREELKKLD